MPEALLRMGELEWEDGRDKFLEEFKRWEKTPADQRNDPPTPNYSKPRARFLRVLKNYKTFSQYDLALYVDGFLANEEGKFGDALGRFNKIIEWFPKSRFIPDAHMVRAEYEFTKDAPNYETAYREYEEVLKFKDSDLYDLALFKSAWTLWRLGRTEEAAQRFLKVFQATEDGPHTKGKSRQELDELQQEALKNLVAVFVEDENNSAEDMFKFLVKAGGDKFAGRIVRALAEAFYEQSHYERGIEAYRLLIKLEPTNPDCNDFMLKIAQGHSTLESWKDLEADYKLTVKDYVAPLQEPGKPKPPGSGWAQVQTAATLTAAENATEKQIREDAVGLHAKAQADKTSKGEYAAAAGLYQVYLSRFGKRPEAYDVNYNLGEINFYHLNNAAGSAEAYLAAVRMNPRGRSRAPRCTTRWLRSRSRAPPSSKPPKPPARSKKRRRRIARSPRRWSSTSRLIRRISRSPSCSFARVSSTTTTRCTTRQCGSGASCSRSTRTTSTRPAPASSSSIRSTRVRTTPISKPGRAA